MRKKHSRRSALVSALAAAILTVGAAGPVGQAGAQQPDSSSQAGADQPPAVNSWALTPGGTTPGQPDNPGSRPNFSYELAPGSTTDDSLSILNYGNVQLTFAVYATDAFNDRTGAFDVLPADKPPKDVGSWVKITQSHVTVPARTKVDMPITLTVPPDALPGDHVGAILAASSVDGIDNGGRKVTVDRRAGSRIYLRVAGPVSAHLAIDRVRATYHGKLNPLDGNLDVTYTVRNVGNVRLPAHQQVSVEAPFGIQLDSRKPPDIAELLPGNSATVRARFEGVPAVVRAAAKVVVRPFDSPGAAPSGRLSSVSRTTSTWAVPWTVIAVVITLAAARSYYRRRKRRREARSAAERWNLRTRIPVS